MTVINLRQARKDRARTEKRAKGDENAAKFGRTKAETAQSRAEAELSARRLDGHLREAGRVDGNGHAPDEAADD